MLWIFIVLLAAKLLQTWFAECMPNLDILYPQKSRLGFKKTS
jgi:hypothetical protein